MEQTFTNVFDRKIENSKFISFIFLILCIISNDRFFYLLPSNGVTRSLYFIFVLSWTLYTILVNSKHKIRLKNCGFLFLNLFAILFVFIASFQGVKNYGQTFINGFFPQRTFLSSFLLCIPIYFNFKANRFNKENLERLLKWIVVLQLIIYFGQWLVAKYLIFLSCLIRVQSFGARMYTNTVCMQFMFFILLERIFNTNAFKTKLKDLIFLFFILLYFIICNQHRNLIITSFMMVITAFIIGKKNIGNKVLLLVPISFVCLSFINSQYFKNIYSILINNLGTMNVRNNARNYYLESLKENNLFWGYGYANSTNLNAYSISGMSKGYLLTDNGIYGFFYTYGLFGVIWYLIYLFFIFINGMKQRKSFNSTILLLIFFYNIFSITIDSFFFENYSIKFTFTFIIYLILKFKTNNKSINKKLNYIKGDIHEKK